MNTTATPCACLINDDDEYERRCAFHRDKEQEAFNQGLEEAAKVAEEYKGYTHNDGATICDNLFSLADEIRQLKTKE